MDVEEDDRWDPIRSPTRTFRVLFIELGLYKTWTPKNENGSASNVAAIVGCIFPTAYKRASNRLCQPMFVTFPFLPYFYFLFSILIDFLLINLLGS